MGWGGGARQAPPPAPPPASPAGPPLLQLSEERDAAIVPIGNLVPDSVPVDDNEVGAAPACAATAALPACCASPWVRLGRRAAGLASPRLPCCPSLPLLPSLAVFTLPSAAAASSSSTRVLTTPQDNNVVAKEVGERRNLEAAPEQLYNHVDLVQLLDIVDLAAGADVAGARRARQGCCGCNLRRRRLPGVLPDKMGDARLPARPSVVSTTSRLAPRGTAGNRGYYLKGEGVLLNQALINCALQFGYTRGFTPVHTPFFMQARARAAGGGGRLAPSWEAHARLCARCRPLPASLAPRCAALCLPRRSPSWPSARSCHSLMRSCTRWGLG